MYHVRCGTAVSVDSLACYLPTVLTNNSDDDDDDDNDNVNDNANSLLAVTTCLLAVLRWCVEEIGVTTHH